MKNFAIGHIEHIYSRDAASKEDNRRFHKAMTANPDPLAGLTAHLIASGNTLINSHNENCHIGIQEDFAPPLENYVGKDICIDVAKRLARAKFSIADIWWYPGIVNFKSCTQYTGIVDIPSNAHKIITADLTKDVKRIMKRREDCLFVGMYMEHRVRNPNCCFPKEPQIRINYIQTIYHFITKAAQEQAHAHLKGIK